MMDEFKLFMQQHLNNLVIHFVGNNDKDFTAAWDTLSDLRIRTL
jgi:hypothetical protein